MKKQMIIIIPLLILTIISLVVFKPNKDITFNSNNNIFEPKMGDISNYAIVANQVNYDNSESGLKSRNVQTAIDELYAGLTSGCYVGYIKASETSTTYICNKTSSDPASNTIYEAENVRFSNSNSPWLESTNVADAILEISQFQHHYCRPFYVKHNETANSYECVYTKLLAPVTLANNSLELIYGQSNGEIAYTYNGDGEISCESSDITKATCSIDTVNNKIIATPVELTSGPITMTISGIETSNYEAPDDVVFTVNIQAECNSGYYLIANESVCSSCPAGKYCTGGTYGFSASNQGITGECQANTYSAGGASVCTACADNKSSVAGASSCFDTVVTYSASNCTYSSSGSSSATVQTFTAPATGTYLLEAWGAQGGKGSSTSTYGGQGGYSKGTIELNAGDKLYSVVGCRGGTPWGGDNGGGSGTQQAGSAGKGGGGGGATHIATENHGFLKGYSSYKSTLLLVGGGGGGISESGNRAGGAGGGTSGGDGAGGNYPGKGATQTAIGARGDSDCTNAGFGYGGKSATGNSASGTYGSGGGGGGYYGGGAGSHKSGGGASTSSGGGGGSGYVNTTLLTDTSTTAGERTGHGQVKITWQGQN